MSLPSLLFVLIWSTGFVVGRVIVPIASPNLFLSARFLLAALMFLVICRWLKLAWPQKQEWPRHLGLGMLMNGFYLAGGYWAVANGLPAAIMALLGALQPMFTLLLMVGVQGQLPSRRLVAGLCVGLMGVLLVLLPGLQHAQQGFSVGVCLIGALAVLSLTVGTLLQKQFAAGVDIRVTSVFQNIGGAVVTLLVAGLLGENHWQMGWSLTAALAWAVVILSGLGNWLLIWMARQQQVTSVASLLYLVPPLAAVESYFLFDNQLVAIQLGGFLLALAGVWLCQQKAR